MGVVLATAAYLYKPTSTGTPFCTATTQSVGYTYYKVASFVDSSIPPWTVRVINTLTGSIGGPGGIGCYMYNCNAQYSTASYGGAQANSNVSTRTTNGTIRAYGMGGKTFAFSSESCYVDSFDNLSTGPECSRVYACCYGTTTTFNLNILRDTTKYLSTWTTGGSSPSWGNQAYLNKCATYTTTGTNAHSYISCSNNTTYTSSAAEAVCSKEYQYTGAGLNLTIQNYYSSSCATY